MALLELKNISKSFAHAQGTLRVLEDVSFTIDEGQFVAIVGPSGCGKSTMLRIINGLMPATAGQVLYQGKQVDGINLECAPLDREPLPHLLARQALARSEVKLDEPYVDRDRNLG